MDTIIRCTAGIPMPVLQLAVGAVIVAIFAALYWIAKPDIDRHDARMRAQRLRREQFSSREQSGGRR